MAGTHRAVGFFHKDSRNLPVAISLMVTSCHVLPGKYLCKRPFPKVVKSDETRHLQTPVCRCLALSAGFPKVAVLPWQVVSIDPLDCIVKFPLSLLRRTHAFA